MRRLFTKRIKSWLGIRASLCAREKWLFLIPSTPVPLRTAVGEGALIAAASWVLQALLSSGPSVGVVWLVFGGIVTICRRQLWRLTVPVVSISRQRGEVVFSRDQPILSIQRVAHLKLSTYADKWQRYREAELSLVLAPDGSDQKVYIFHRNSFTMTPDDSDRQYLILSRNNADHEPRIFRAEFPEDEMVDLAQTLAEEIGVPFQIERKTEEDVLQGPLA